MASKKGLTVKQFVKVDDDLMADQEAVMQHYKDWGAVANPHEVEALHMFFSPFRVPRGLRKWMIKEIIRIYPLKQWHRHQYQPGSLMKILMGRPMPKEILGGMTSISKADFLLGMKKFKLDVAQLLIADVCGTLQSTDMPLDLGKILKPIDRKVSALIRRRNKRLMPAMERVLKQTRERMSKEKDAVLPAEAIAALSKKDYAKYLASLPIHARRLAEGRRQFVKMHTTKK